MAKTALVLGGTGRLGAPIAAQLVDAGYTVTVFARPNSDRARLADLPIDYIMGDLLDGDSVSSAVHGKSFDIVVDASARGPNPEPFYVAVMENILAALDAKNVKQFILHGSIGAGNSKNVFSDAMYKRMRGVMAEKTQAEELLKASGIPYTIIRNGVVKLDGTPATGTAELTEDPAVMGSVTRPDLAALTMQCLANKACINKTLHAVDPSWVNNPGY
jgi:uncharacterized protein YbjT (DUF2867 family)